MSNKLINSGNLNQALAAFYTKSTALFATKTELDSGLAGKANSSHGTHVTWATNTPKANGTAAIGSAARVAREDHVHPLQTTVSGNAGSADKVNNSLAIKLNGGTTEGTNLFTFNGSAAKTINITPAGIGASATGHTHDDRYYTESEINTKVSTLNTAISTAQTAAQTYADNKIAALVDSAPDAMNTLNELATAINAHQDVYTAYVAEMTTALAGKANSSHGNHVPATETANNAKFLRNDNTWATVTPANIGAAPTSHASSATTYGVSSASNYGHAKASSTTPKAAGTAAVGSETSSFARGDHVHPVQTTVSGNAGSATKLATARDITIGNKTNSFNGTANISYTLSDIGAAPISHGHHASYCTCETAAATAEKVVVADDKFVLEAGAIIAVKFTATNSATNVKLNVNSKGAYPIWAGNAEVTAASSGYTGYANRVYTYMFSGSHWIWISSSIDNNTTYTNQSLGNGYGTCATEEATVAKVVTLSSYALTTNGSVSIKFTYAVPASATMNINSKGAKAIYYRGAAITAGVIKAGDVATFIYNGSQYHLTAIDRWQADTAGSIKALSVSGKVITYTKNDGTTGTITTQDTNTTYTADTGIKLNGTTFQHTNAVTAGTAQGDANKTLSWGGTFTIPTVTYDAQGHITGKGTTTMTMPSNPNSDTKVTNTLGTTTKFYVTGTTSSTTATGTQYFDTGVYVSTTAGELVATKFTGALNGKANTAGTADKVANSLVIKVNSGTTEGTDMFTFNGSAAKTVNLQCATEDEITAMIDEIWG